MPITRRALLTGVGGGGLAGLALHAKGIPGLRIGVMDGVVGLAGKPEAVAVAAKLGFEGIQLTIGGPDAAGNLALMDPALQARFLAESRRHKVVLAGTYLDILHKNCLKNDETAKKWVRQGIEITRNLKARILMTVFFGNCALATHAEMDAVADALKVLAPEAEKAGVILGFENLLRADDNLYVLDKVNSRALMVYYDPGNLTNMVGADAPAEVRRLGKRICQFHFKDRGYLGEGKVNFPALLRAIRDTGYRGWGILETNWPSKDMEADNRRNLEFVRAAIREME